MLLVQKLKSKGLSNLVPANTGYPNYPIGSRAKLTSRPACPFAFTICLYYFVPVIFSVYGPVAKGPSNTDSGRAGFVLW